MVANPQTKVAQNRETPATRAHGTDPRPRTWIGPLLESIILISLLVLFNAYPDYIGIYLTAGDASSFVPLLAPEFQQYMPWLNLWWGCTLLLKLIHVGYGQGHLLTRLATVGVNLLGIRIFWQMLTGAPVIGIDPAWVAEHRVAIPALAAFAEETVPMLVYLTRFVFGVAIFGTVIDTVQQVYRSFLGVIKI